MDEIKVSGARIHNLLNVNLSIPKRKLVAVTGVSGSGKSSLAFDILFEEGKNQYLRSIGILGGLDNEDRFDTITGIGPTVSVRQNTIRQSNPRSTVGSKIGILNQLALLYASEAANPEDKLSPGAFLYTTADGMCMQCQGKGSFYDVNIEQLIDNKEATLLEVYQYLKVTSGFIRVLQKKYGEYFDTPFFSLPENIREEVIYGTLESGKQSYCIERNLRNAFERGEDVSGVYEKKICPECQGERLTEETRQITFFGKRMGELGQMNLTELLSFLNTVHEEALSVFGKNIIKSLKTDILHLIHFRLGHLTLYREMATLSGGEIQRIFLHLHLESALDSLVYVFDEPMAGLHPSEKQEIIQALKRLRDIGNTVIVVEHDRELIKQADHIIEFGPGAGRCGGKVVFEGDYRQYLKADTLLSRYFCGKSSMPMREWKQPLFEQKECLEIEHADIHYLKDLNVKIPLHRMVGIAGMSGSGKSSLMEDTLLKRLNSAKKYGTVKNLKGFENISGFVTISQEPIGRSASSTPASYIGIWDKIRELFADQEEAKNRQLDAGWFSFHSKGACKDCGGSGYERIFLTADFSVDKTCKTCQGNRYNEESLAVTYHGKSITEILSMSIQEAVVFFKEQESIVKPLMILQQMGMGYLTLGQPTPTLSGGEAQRIKLAKELGKRNQTNILYILDEPSNGLSLYDTALLLKLLDQLVKEGNSVIVIEHNTEILKQCDYLIELGPEGGEKGGQVIACGTPDMLAQNNNSKTGRYLV